MTWYSQAGQDRFVIDNAFRHHEHGGYFVDVGAHDGVVHSNTYALERSFGWTGICIEPNPDVFPTLVANRPGTICERVASSSASGIARFTGDRIAGAGPYEVQCERLATTLDWHDAPPVIDYLSIDVEGHELQVLAGMDFDRWSVHLITVEHNLYLVGAAHKEAIFAVLSGLGFERVVEDAVAPGYGPYEDWFCNREFLSA